MSKYAVLGVEIRVRARVCFCGLLLGACAARVFFFADINSVEPKGLPLYSDCNFRGLALS